MDVLYRSFPDDAVNHSRFVSAGRGAGRMRESAPYPRFVCDPLHLPFATFRYLLDMPGPSLALWRTAEIAASKPLAWHGHSLCRC